MARERWRPKHAVDTERTKIIRCNYCRANIRFGYGDMFPCNLDGTNRVDNEAIGALR